MTRVTMDLIDLKESRNIKMEFESMVLKNFWSAGLEIYPKLAKKSTGRSPSFLDYLSLQSRVFFPGLLKE